MTDELAPSTTLQPAANSLEQRLNSSPLNVPIDGICEQLLKGFAVSAVHTGDASGGRPNAIAQLESSRNTVVLCLTSEITCAARLYRAASGGLMGWATASTTVASINSRKLKNALFASSWLARTLGSMFPWKYSQRNL